MKPDEKYGEIGYGEMDRVRKQLQKTIVGELTLVFFISTKDHQKGIQGILETLSAKKELRVFNLYAPRLGNDEDPAYNQNPAFEKTLKTLAKSLAGMPRLNTL